MYIVLSVLLGVLIGALLPWSIPAQYSIYAAVMLLAALDAAAGGINARLHHKFRGSLFVSGALGNGLIAVFLTYMGERIGISLYLAAAWLIFFLPFMPPLPGWGCARCRLRFWI